MTRPTTALVVGNPKPRSRTSAAGSLVVEGLTGAPPDLVVDLTDVGAALLDWQDAGVSALVEQVRTAALVVVASPTYKGTYTGLLKLFLDRFGTDALRGVVSVPLMLGAGPGHALAAELSLRPVLTELGATVPVRGLYLLDSTYDAPGALDDWLAQARPAVAAALGARVGALA